MRRTAGDATDEPGPVVSLMSLLAFKPEQRITVQQHPITASLFASTGAEG
jgi:hypothetical protein